MSVAHSVYLEGALSGQNAMLQGIDNRVQFFEASNAGFGATVPCFVFFWLWMQ